MKFQDKVVLITGAANGIGYACAEAFAKEGANIMLVDIDKDVQSAATKIAKDFSVNTSALIADLSDSTIARGVVAKTVEALGKVNILINNAGMLITGDILDLHEDDFDKVMSVNLKAYFILSQEASKQMIKQGGEGNIINMSSINAILANPTQLAYAVSKGGVNQLTRVMAVALAPHNIRVNAIGPGTIKTAAAAVIVNDKDIERAVLSRTPIGRLGEASEVAEVALFLAGDAGSYMLGQTVYPDGGRLILNYTVPVED